MLIRVHVHDVEAALVIAMMFVSEELGAQIGVERTPGARHQILTAEIVAAHLRSARASFTSPDSSMKEIKKIVCVKHN